MGQINSLVKTLKLLLKKHGKTYEDVARNLHISVASVKRSFAQKKFTIDRLEKICAMLDLELTDLLHEVRSNINHVTQLTLNQEKSLVADLQLLLVAICVMNRWSVQEITTCYQITETKCIQKLLELDKIKFIELLPKNRYKVLIAGNFQWLKDGPVQNFFYKYLQQDFLAANFNQENEFFTFRFGMLTKNSNLNLQKNLAKIADEFSEKCEENLKLPLTEKAGSALVIALRPWVPSIFDKLKK
jgi:DNA-binding Xre family transcriptional regulator